MRATLAEKHHICGPASSSFGLIFAIASHLLQARQLGHDKMLHLTDVCRQLWFYASL